MTSEIYPKLPDNEIRRLEMLSKENEQKWLLSTIILPEIPKILDTLSRCLELITSEDGVILPITSNRTEDVRGVISRRSNELTKMDFLINLQKKTKLKLKLQKNIELLQVTDVVDLINFITTEVRLLNEYQDEIEEFGRRLHSILKGLIKCNQFLNKPSNDVLFPQHKIKLDELFQEVDGVNLGTYQDKLTIDFYLSNGEIAIEFKYLEKVKEAPWNQINQETGKSHIDELRDDLKHHRIKLADILKQEKKVISSMFDYFNKFTINDYLTRGVTFDSKVVIETEKILIHIQDPNILSVSAKLNGLEHLVSKMYKNLEMSLI